MTSFPGRGEKIFFVSPPAALLCILPPLSKAPQCLGSAPLVFPPPLRAVSPQPPFYHPPLGGGRLFSPFLPLLVERSPPTPGFPFWKMGSLLPPQVRGGFSSAFLADCLKWDRLTIRRFCRHFFSPQFSAFPSQHNHFLFQGGFADC